MRKVRTQTLAILAVLATIVLCAPLLASAQNERVIGDWQEPGGSVVRVAACGGDVCAQLVALSPKSPYSVDGQNPDPGKRSRPLCGLTIGYGFHLTAPGHAEGGHLYDPKSGRTYQGEMTAHGDVLELRGYVGIRAFGRSEEWRRLDNFTGACSPQ